jgi:hypothetical protein
MSEPGMGAPAPADAQAAALQARIAALRDLAARADPVRLRYVEALAARVSRQTDPVRGLLYDKLAAAVAACEQRCAGQPPIAPRKKGGAIARTPLAELNQHARAAAPRANASDRGEAAGLDELPNARRFRRAWLGTHTQEQVQQAAGRKPANAGPLNSHALVLESLAIMSRLSPDYLRRFVVHVQALQWLDQASVDDAPPVKGAARAKKGTARATRRK